MTKREAAIMSAFTGIMIGSFSDMHKYVEEIMKRKKAILDLINLKFSRSEIAKKVGLQKNNLEKFCDNWDILLPNARIDRRNKDSEKSYNTMFHNAVLTKAWI